MFPDVIPTEIIPLHIHKADAEIGNIFRLNLLHISLTGRSGVGDIFRERGVFYHFFWEVESTSFPY